MLYIKGLLEKRGTTRFKLLIGRLAGMTGRGESTSGEILTGEMTVEGFFEHLSCFQKDK